MRVVPGGTVLVSGVRRTVLSGRAGMCGGQEAGGRGWRLQVVMHRLVFMHSSWNKRYEFKKHVGRLRPWKFESLGNRRY